MVRELAKPEIIEELLTDMYGNYGKKYTLKYNN